MYINNMMKIRNQKIKIKAYNLRIPESEFNVFEEYCKKNYKAVVWVIRELIEKKMIEEGLIENQTKT